METPEKPPESQSFWTRDIILLLGLNIVLLGIIIYSMLAIFGVFTPALTAWIQKKFGL